MSDTPINLLSWNVCGFSYQTEGLHKRHQFCVQVRDLSLKPNLIFFQEYKMKQELCDKTRALEIRRAKALWNGVVVSPETNRYRRET